MAQLIDILQAGLCDSSGNPLANGKVTTFVAGTTTKQTIFQDEELTNPFPNPVTVDSRGKLQAYTNQNLKLIIETAAGSTVDTIENIVNPRGNIGTDEIQNDAVTAAKINANVAGKGLTQATSGALNVNPDNSTIEVVTNEVRVKDSGITTAKLNDGAVTKIKQGSAGQQISDSSGTSTNLTTAFAQVINHSINITTFGRPVMVFCQPDGTANEAELGISSLTFSTFGVFELRRDAVAISTWQLHNAFTGVTGTNDRYNPHWTFMDVIGAGTYVYTFHFKVVTTGSSQTVLASNLVLGAFEL